MSPGVAPSLLTFSCFFSFLEQWMNLKLIALAAQPRLAQLAIANQQIK